MKFIRITIIAIIVLLASPLALPQASTPSNVPAPSSQNPAQPAATTPPATGATPAAADQPVDTMPRKYIDLWNTGKFDHVANFFVPVATIVSHGNRTLLKPELLRKVITAWRKAMPDLNFKIEDTIIQGDKVVMRLTLAGTYKDRLFPNTAVPSPENPRTVRATEILIFQIKEGKIFEIWEESDEMRMRIEMGGRWRSDEELEAAAGQSSREAPVKAPPPETPQKP